MTMRKLSKEAKRLFGPLIDQVDETENGHLKIDNGGEGIMALVVESIGVNTPLYSFTHYYEQNGDLVPDPEVVLFKSPVNGELFPASIQQPFPPGVREAIVFDEDGQPEKYSRKAQHRIASFCTKWARNIKAQQGI
jgi:hypothetical protein